MRYTRHYTKENMTEATPLHTYDGMMFKREDHNLSGSIKDRGMSTQIKQAILEGHTNFVLSSSGNAAISAAYICRQKHLNLVAFVSQHINRSKLQRLRDFGIDLRVVDQPLTDSLKFAEETGAFHLRQATSQTAVEGYARIASELLQQMPELAQAQSSDIGIFVPVSSGTSLIGMYQSFAKPEFHAVQTAAIHPIAGEFDTNFRRKARSLADAIVPPLDPPRKKAVIDAIRKTNGGGWVISDQEILEADSWLQQHDIHTSYEGALALAGYRKFCATTGRSYRYPIIILTGTRYTDTT